jgi:hypothetical protein
MILQNNYTTHHPPDTQDQELNGHPTKTNSRKQTPEAKTKNPEPAKQRNHHQHTRVKNYTPF